MKAIEKTKKISKRFIIAIQSDGQELYYKDFDGKNRIFTEEFDNAKMITNPITATVIIDEHLSDFGTEIICVERTVEITRRNVSKMHSR